MDTQSIRSAFLSAPEKTADVEIPEWLQAVIEPGTELAWKDIPSDVLRLLQRQAERNPDQNDANVSAAIICKSLINKTTGELIFQPADRDAVASLGSTKLDPLYRQVVAFFGFTATGVADAKKN